MREGLERYLRDVFNSYVVVADRSWGHGEACVLEVRDRSGVSWFAKRHRGERNYRREVTAYRRWVPALGGYAPSLRAADDELRVVVMTGIPGEVYEGDLAEVHHQAGVLLRRFHDAEPPVPMPDFASSMADQLEGWLARAGGVLDVGEVDFARAQVRLLAELPVPDGCPCHLDYQPRNWLVDDAGTVRVIDFAHARIDVWARDLNRMYWDDWWGRPDLREAFLDGYGRRLEGDDLALLLACSAHAGATTVVWAHGHGDPEFAAHGHRILARLRDHLANPGSVT